MGSRFGPNYACLFVGHIEEQIFQQYRGKTPDLYKRYIDDIVGAASGTKEELEDFATFVNNFHPSLKFTWAISDDKLPFLDLYLTPSSNRLITTIHYKETDSHSYLNYSSSHPVRCKNSIPYSQFLRLRWICSEEEDFRTRSEEMTSFFTCRGYPPAVVNQALQRVRSTPSESTINSNTAPSTEEQAVPLVLAYHPRNTQVREIITRNFALLKSNPDTKDIFQPVRILCAYRRDNNLRDILVKSSLQTTGPTDGESGTFPCGRPRCVTCAHTNPSQTLDTPGGQLRFEDKFTCTTSNLIYVLSCRKCSKLYIGETGRRLGDRFREHIRSVGANTDLPVGKHFSSPGHSVGDVLVSVICAGFRTTMVRRSMEARLIFRHKTLQPNGMNIDFTFL